MSIFTEAFLDGVTGAGLFGKLRWPGAPTELIDSRTVDEFLASGDFERSMKGFGYHRVDEPPAEVPRPVRQIRIRGRDGTMGVLSPDGQHVTWYVDGVEVSGTEVLHADMHGEFKVSLKSPRGADFEMAAEDMREHAGRR
jgi:hypothetical protein